MEADPFQCNFSNRQNWTDPGNSLQMLTNALQCNGAKAKAMQHSLLYDWLHYFLLFGLGGAVTLEEEYHYLVQ